MTQLEVRTFVDQSEVVNLMLNLEQYKISIYVDEYTSAAVRYVVRM